MAARRTQLVERFRANFTPKLEQLRARLKSTGNDLTADAEAARPAVDWADPASVQRAQAKWDQARMRLTAGIPLNDLIATADIDTLVALREWAPAWLDAQGYRGQGRSLADALDGAKWQATDLSALNRSIDKRLVELVGGDTAAAIEAANEAAALAAYAAPLLTQMSAHATGTPTSATPLSAVVEATFAEQAARTTWQDPQPAEAETA